MSKIKVLLAEDEPALAMIIKESLDSRNFEITLASNGSQALEIYKKSKFDVLIFDVMMPEVDGYTLTKEIRKTDRSTPIIMLTAKSLTEDVIQGFKSGANDFIKKPFSMEELIIRIESLLNRASLKDTSSSQMVGKFEFNYVKQTLVNHEESYVLTHKETELLQILLHNKNEIVDRSAILIKIWGKDDFFNGRSMDVYITKLRKKLASDPNVQIINTRGQGYKLII